MKEMKRIVISLCDYTGNMVKPWAEAGYECWCVDLRHIPGYAPSHYRRNITKIGADVLKWSLPKAEYAIAFGFPPCTHLAVSGARWWKGKGLKPLSEAIELVGRCAELCDETGAPWMLENPIGSLSTYWRKPDAQFDPCDYGGYLEPPGDEYTKRTCLWTGGGLWSRFLSQCFPSRVAGCTCYRRQKTGQTCGARRQWDLHGRYLKRMNR